MKRILLLVIFITVCSPIVVNANIMCKDGTTSPTCQDCHQGCCSHHGGCASGGYSYNNYNNIISSCHSQNEIDQLNTEINKLNDALETKKEEIYEYQNEILKLEDNVDELEQKADDNLVYGVAGGASIPAIGAAAAFYATRKKD